MREATDHVFLVQFDMGIEFRQKLTSSRKDFEDALRRVELPSMRQLELQRDGGTLLYEAVAVAARDVMRPLEGRKALIMLSDGVDTQSEVPLTTAIEEAQRAGTLIYSIVFSDANAYGPRSVPCSAAPIPPTAALCSSACRVRREAAAWKSRSR